MFDFDINDVMAVALELGLDVEINAEKPGFYFVDGEHVKGSVTFKQLQGFTKKFFSLKKETITYDTVFTKKARMSIDYDRNFTMNKPTNNFSGPVTINIIGKTFEDESRPNTNLDVLSSLDYTDYKKSTSGAA